MKWWVKLSHCKGCNDTVCGAEWEPTVPQASLPKQSTGQKGLFAGVKAESKVKKTFNLTEKWSSGNIFLRSLMLLLLCVSGILRTAVPDMDRETQDQYLVLLQAKDMGGHLGGLSGTTTVTVKLTDVNDNPPRFTQSELPRSSRGHTHPRHAYVWLGLIIGFHLLRSSELSVTVQSQPWLLIANLVLTFWCWACGHERTHIRLHHGINTGFVLHQKAEAFSDLSDLQALSGFSQQQSGAGDSCRAAKCLIKHSVLDFWYLCNDTSASASNCSRTFRL